MVIGAVVLAIGTVKLDESVTEKWVVHLHWVYTGGAAGANAVLGTIASSMMTVTGLVFSMTLVTLSLASSQFGPRLLRNFMRDTTNQVVLGTFVSTFLYCLLVLRTIRRAEEIEFVPHLSVTIGVVFALVSLGVLIYFIHHVAVSIQADEIVARVGGELAAGIEGLFPEAIGEEKPGGGEMLPAGFEREARAIESREDGYLQLVDAQSLMELAEREHAVFRLERRPGNYVVKGGALVVVWPGDRVTDELARQVNSAFVVGNQRTPTQDVEFMVNELVEIAARALSPGINDPFTAIACVDRLGSALCRLAGREIPSGYRKNKEGELRVVAPVTTFVGILDAAFNPIREYSRTTRALAIRLLETIEMIARAAHRSQDCAALRRHAEMIERGAREGLAEEEDRRVVTERYQAAISAIGTTKEGERG
jgi:uncharacterized membrane protein